MLQTMVQASLHVKMEREREREREKKKKRENKKAEKKEYVTSWGQSVIEIAAHRASHGRG